MQKDKPNTNRKQKGKKNGKINAYQVEPLPLLPEQVKWDEAISGLEGWRNENKEERVFSDNGKKLKWQRRSEIKSQ
ncbi:hypothetical protein AAC387_Pa04g0850 [Persea americana]